MDTPDTQSIVTRLERAIPRVQVELDHANPWQLLVATILSAQSTDRTVNRVTPILFARYATPAALAAASQEDIEDIVQATGFFRNKARAIRETSQMLVERFRGEVPRTMEELLELPGVARKTANLVLGIAYGIPSGVVVDTHVGRVARRLRLTAHEKSPKKVEADLSRIFPQKQWIDLGTRLLLHGRYVCTARAPACGFCPLNELCPTREAPPVGPWTLRADAALRHIESRGAKPLDLA